MTLGKSSWWTPGVHADRRPFLLARNRIVSRLRRHFEDEGFVEADCGALQVSPGNEAHLHAFGTDLFDNEGKPHRRYLHTSPEFACKKLLAAGEARLFSMTHVFRNRERTRTHVPEFTMLEWYRANEPYDGIVADTIEIIRLAARSAGTSHFSWRGKTADPQAPAERLSVAEAFRRYAGVDLLAALTADGKPLREALAEQSPVPVAASDSWSDIFSAILVERIEPHLGQGHITILDEYPACEAALARISPRDPRVAERFEAYVCGVELANGFGELTDAVEQRRRFEADMDLKERIYRERYPLDEDFLAALAIMPPASGVALGLDRLVMLAAGASSIDQVIWTPAT